MRLCILADDLTGALDAAAPFAGRGMTVTVALRPASAATAVATGAEVVAISTCSREIGAADAQAAVAEAVAALPADVRIFKKIDSRMKGHIAAEIAVLAPDRLLVAPAIPEFGRLVAGGAVCGFGVTEPIAVAAALGDLAGRATIPDAATPAEMRAALDRAGAGDLLVGARGLAEALAIRLTGRETATPARPRARRALMVVGSHDPITLAQVAALRGRGAVDWRPAPLGVLAPSAAPVGPCLVQAVPGHRAADGATVAAALARSVHPALTGTADALFLTGGATAEAVLDVMGIDTLDLRGECLPGLPVAQAGALTVIAKSGGFGDENTLIGLAGMFDGAE